MELVHLYWRVYSTGRGKIFLPKYVCQYHKTYHAKGLIPYLGGDFNSRLGDINLLLPGSSWKHLKNVDSVTNMRGRTFFKDMRITADIKPINCLKYKQILVENDFSFVDVSGKSQIDFVLTDKI